MLSNQVILWVIIIVLVIYIIKRPKTEQNTSLKREIDSLREILENQGKQISQENLNQSTRLANQVSQIDNNLNKTQTQSVQYLKLLIDELEKRQKHQSKQEQEQTDKLIKELTQIETMNKTIVTLEQNVLRLSQILGDKKLRGSYGEGQLYTIIDSFFGANNNSVTKQHKLDNGMIVDLSIWLANRERVLAIDSKFPLENYVQYEQTNDKSYYNLFERDVKKHIDAINSKYIIESQTTKFAIMFIPSESIYLFVADNTNLINYSYNKGVWIASPTTLIALIGIINELIVDYQIAQNADQIEAEIGVLTTEFERFNIRYQKLQKHAHMLVKDLEEVSVTTRKIEKRFEQIKAGKVEDE